MPHAYIAKIHGLVDPPPNSFEQAIGALEEFASVKCYSRGQEIFGDYGEQKYLYRVRAGVTGCVLKHWRDRTATSLKLFKR